ncbi:MAG: thymidylate synthase [Bacteroidetes bacterium]|nr:thymidylate synthase [Bacteroidota bacterium]
MITFNGKSADEVWKKIVREMLDDNTNITDSRLGSTKEILHAGITFENPRDRWIFSRKPSLNPAFALAEVVWIVNGKSNANFLNFWNSSLPNFAGNVKNYYGAYGSRLRDYNGIDQLERAYKALSNNSKTRQVVLQIWNPSKDLPFETGRPRSKDIPCNICSIPKVRDNKLEWMQVLRSNDIFLGVPYNFVQFTYLQEVLAGWLGIELGTYNQLSDSLHVYEKDFKNLLLSSEEFKKNPKIDSNLDSIAIDKKNSEKLFNQLESICNQLIFTKVTSKEVLEIIKWKNATESFRNILLIITSEFARRKGLDYLIEEILSNCSNPVLLFLWENWYKRFKEQKIIT